MAIPRAPGILLRKMVVGDYIERHSLICCLLDRRCAIERLGGGWLFLSFLPIYHPAQATRPGLLRNALSANSSVREGGNEW